MDVFPEEVSFRSKSKDKGESQIWGKRIKIEILAKGTANGRTRSDQQYLPMRECEENSKMGRKKQKR